jgi:hypothetical protein
VDQEKFAASTLRRAQSREPASTVQLVQSQTFENTYRRVHGAVRCTRCAPAIPSTVVHLLLEQIFGNGVEAIDASTAPMCRS